MSDAANEYKILPVGSEMMAVFLGGRQVSPATRDMRKVAEALAEKERIAAKAIKPGAPIKCLGCEREFRTAGPGNRLCQSCATSREIDLKIPETLTHVYA